MSWCLWHSCMGSLPRLWGPSQCPCLAVPPPCLALYCFYRRRSVLRCSYCKRILAPTFWGGEPELLVLSQMLKVRGWGLEAAGLRLPNPALEECSWPASIDSE